MSNITTRDRGIRATIKILLKLGATNISEFTKENKKFIAFQSLTDRKFTITTRARTSGTWQTTINYGIESQKNINEKEYWIFVDLSKEPNEFYIVPLWWIQNDIYEAHKNYLNSNDGVRPKNDKSKHHGIKLERIIEWHNRWDLIELK